MNWFQSSADYNIGEERYPAREEQSYIYMYDGEVEPEDDLAVISI